MKGSAVARAEKHLQLQQRVPHLAEEVGSTDPSSGPTLHSGRCWVQAGFLVSNQGRGAPPCPVHPRPVASSQSCRQPPPSPLLRLLWPNLHLAGRRGPPSLQPHQGLQGASAPGPSLPSQPRFPRVLAPQGHTPLLSAGGPAVLRRGSGQHRLCRPRTQLPPSRPSQRSARLSPRAVPAPTQRQTFSPSHLLRDAALETSVFPTTLTSYFLSRELNLSHKYTKMLFPM